MELARQLCTFEQGKRFKKVDIQDVPYFGWELEKFHDSLTLPVPRAVVAAAFKEPDVWPAWSCAELELMWDQIYSVLWPDFLQQFDFKTIAGCPMVLETWKIYVKEKAFTINNCRYRAEMRAEGILQLLETGLIRAEVFKV